MAHGALATRARWGSMEKKSGGGRSGEQSTVKVRRPESQATTVKSPSTCRPESSPQRRQAQAKRAESGHPPASCGARPSAPTRSRRWSRNPSNSRSRPSPTSAMPRSEASSGVKLSGTLRTKPAAPALRAKPLVPNPSKASDTLASPSSAGVPPSRQKTAARADMTEGQPICLRVMSSAAGGGAVGMEICHQVYWPSDTVW